MIINRYFKLYHHFYSNFFIQQSMNNFILFNCILFKVLTNYISIIKDSRVVSSDSIVELSDIENVGVKSSS